MIRELHVLLLCTAVMVGCSSPPKERFYVLGSAGNMQVDAETANYSVDIDRITLPESVDRAQIVVHTGSNQVDISELNRWAEPLKKSIPRFIASQLVQQLGTRRVYIYPQQALPAADYRIAMNILRMDASTKTQEVTLESLWSIHQSIKGDPKSGHSLIQEPYVVGDYDALVAAYERALVRLSGDIAQSTKILIQTHE